MTNIRTGYRFPCLLWLIVACVSTSCSKSKTSNTCISYQVAPVTAVAGLHTGTVNQDISLMVSFDIVNGCGQFGNFTTTADADTTVIVVNAKYTGCVCTQLAGTLQAAYTFRPGQPGTYYFKFYQADLDYIRDSVVVQ